MNTLDGLITDGLLGSILNEPFVVPDPAPSLREVWIAIRTDGVPDVTPANPVVIGDGTFENPWDGSTALKLDLILRTKVGEYTIIHFGPGLFRTGGAMNASSYVKWQPKSGQKIIGAGRFQTTLLLTVYDPGLLGYQGSNYFFIVNSLTDYLDGFQISDLTLDVGNDDQPLPPDARFSFPQYTCAGLWLAGRNIVVRRVRFVNLGNRSPLMINGKSIRYNWESYPAVLALFDANDGTPTLSFNLVMEDCTFEQPFHSNGRETSPITVGVWGPPGEYMKGMAVRRCYLNMEYVNRLPYPPTKVRQVIYNAGAVTINGGPQRHF